ncbi:MAG: ribosomal RNA small subunit methyltransferase A [Nanoarchaeota archaeon]|nr:ribosomal RNA small subunit methyltransferase A [Nanoarchaeota archaeon]
MRKLVKEIEDKGIKLDKTKDQHFMVDETLLKKIVSEADVQSNEVVLEIGAGSGNLTKHISRKAKQVFAIEKDIAMKEVLNETFPSGSNVYVIYADALKTDFPFFDKVVSNLPYSICEPFVNRLFRYFFKRAVLTVPKAFAERLLSKPGDEKYSKLSLLVQTFFDVKIVAEVPKNAFHPEPSVGSSIIVLESKKETPFLKNFLIQDDKRVKNALREALFDTKGLSKGGASKKVSEAGLPEKVLNKRVSALSLDEIQELISKF